MSKEVIISHKLIDEINSSGFQGQNEHGAWLMFSRSHIEKDTWTESPKEQYLLREIRVLNTNDIESASPSHLTMKTTSFVRVLQEVGDNFVAGFIHGHPSGADNFSQMDDENEKALLSAAQNRNGKNSKLVSLIILPNGRILARCWNSIHNVEKCDVTITGPNFFRFEKDKSIISKDENLDRQARIFGNNFNHLLSKIRILVVGAGGTGSSLALMLARAGVKHLCVIDPDTVEATNLHRLYGAQYKDIGNPKAQVLADHIKSINVGTNIVGIVGNILDSDYIDAIKSADLIFTATDDNASRLLLNRYAYFYLTPVIDLGLASDINENGVVKDLTGRVTLLYPGATCLLCRRVIDPIRAREEELQRRSPEEFEGQLKEGYIIGGGAPEPAFISMTTSTACMALNEFTQMCSGFRGEKRTITQRLRRFHIPEDRISGGEPDPDCSICGSTSYWGRGDMKPFLDRIS